MGTIYRNGIQFGGGQPSVELTQAEYDALPASKLTNGVEYYITDGNNPNVATASQVMYDNTDSGLSATDVQNAIDEIAETGGGAGVSVLTYAEYQELVDAGEVNPDISYYISDSNTTGTNYAAGISYDNTESGMAATDVQEAVDELSSIITTSTDSVTGTKWTVKKYSNGDMEIWGNKYYTPDSDISFTAWGAWYGVTFTPGTYPQTFYSIPCVVGQVQIENVGGVSSIQATPSVSAAPQITVMRPTAAIISTTFHINICVYARGRWKV